LLQTVVMVLELVVVMVLELVVVMVLELVVVMVLELVVVAAMWVTKAASVTVVMAILHAVAAIHGSSCTHLGRGLLSVELCCSSQRCLAAAAAAVWALRKRLTGFNRLKSLPHSHPSK